MTEQTIRVPLWALFTRTKQTGHGVEELLSVYRDFGVIRRSDRDDNDNRPGQDLDAYQLVVPGDLVVNKMKAWQGSLGISNYRGIVSPAYYVYRRNNRVNVDVNMRYLNYVVRSRPFTDKSASNSKGIRPAQWDLIVEAFEQFQIPIPSVSIQRAIADYLDRETAVLDEITILLDEFTRLLREFHESKIIGTMPITSNTSASPFPEVSLGSVGVREKISNEGMKESNLLSLSHGRIKRRNIQTTEGLLPTSFETYQIVQPNDIIFRFTDLQNDQNSLRNGLVTEVGIITSAYINYRPNPTILDARYANYSFRALDLSKAFYSMGTGVRQTLKYEELARTRIPLPPIEEQRRIADYLDAETAKIDQMITTANRIRNLLTERKSALITATVTGHNDAYKEFLEVEN